MRFFAVYVFALFCFGTALHAQHAAPTVDWKFTRLDVVEGHKATIVGSPRLIDTLNGNGIQFDGESGLFLDANLLTGLKLFTVEIVFQPYGAGTNEQRFLHFQENGSDNRLLFEIRLTDDNRWFLDTFIKSGEGNYTLYAENFKHPIGRWYHAAVVMDGTTMRHYVNGTEEMSTPIKFTPQKEGRTSIGVRINRVSWFTGAMHRLRITPRVLTPPEFLPH